MPINIDQWRAITVLLYDRVYAVVPNNKNSYDCNMKILILLFFFYSAFVFLILLMDGDIESNPEPKTITENPFFFSYCYWNFNNLLAHNKLSVLEAYNIAHKYDVIFTPESYLDSTIPLDYNSVFLSDYSLTCAEHPDNVKFGLSLSKKSFFICFNDSSSKVMKNAFYFILKALFVVKILKVFSWPFGLVEKTAWLERSG